MGGSFSVSVSYDQFKNVSQILCFKESYIQSLEENLTALRKDMEELKAREIEVLKRVEIEEDTRGHQRLPEVKVWLQIVDRITGQVSNLLGNITADLETLSDTGLCSKSLRSNHGYGEIVSLMLEKVNDLKSRGVFEVVVEPIEELECLKGLESLYVDISSTSALEQFSSRNRLVHCIEEICIRDLEEKANKTTLVLPTMKRLRKLIISNCDIKEIEIGLGSYDVILTRARCSNLSSVVITGCNGLKDLTWLHLFPNLTHLKLQSLEKLEEILSVEKAAGSVTDEQKLDDPFVNLERIELSNLPMLKSIHWLPLDFPYLRTVDVEKCPKLRKLPLNSESCIDGQEVVINYRDDKWIKRIRWQDKATKDRFLPCCEKLMPSK